MQLHEGLKILIIAVNVNTQMDSDLLSDKKLSGLDGRGPSAAKQSGNIY